MKIKTAEAKDAALDWLVAKCEGWDGFDVHSNGAFELERSDTGDCLWLKCFEPSTDWAQGGPIIEREGIDICTSTRGGWIATLITDWEEDVVVRGEGDTCLIAAMRCYVASKLGDEVEIPKELA